MLQRVQMLPRNWSVADTRQLNTVQRDPHTTLRSVEQTWVQTLILIYGGSVLLLQPAALRSPSAFSLTPGRLFSAPGSLSQQTASGPPVHLSPWSPPSPGSETGRWRYGRKWAAAVLRFVTDLPCRRRSLLSRTAAQEGWWFWERAEPAGRRCSRHRRRPPTQKNYLLALFEKASMENFLICNKIKKKTWMLITSCWRLVKFSAIKITFTPLCNFIYLLRLSLILLLNTPISV